MTPREAAILGTLVVLLGVSVATCGGEPTAPPDPPPPNRAPVAVGTVPALELAVGDSATFNLDDYFRDPDGDALTYTPGTDAALVAAASVSGSTLTVRTVAKGQATISVTATDPGGLTADQGFPVVVPNRAPIVTDSIPPQRLTVGEEPAWTGTDYFTDPDGDVLTYTIGTTDSSVVLAAVTGDDFAILAVTPGAATVTVTATDGDGLNASQSIAVTSEAQLPVVISDVEPGVLLEGANATITGSGFSRFPEYNSVSIDGQPATVIAASRTSLSVTVPHGDCLPARRAPLSVTVLGLSETRIVGVTPRTPEDLALPLGSYRYTHGGNGCVHLPGDASGGEYIIGVVSTSETPSSLTPVHMTSVLGDAAVLDPARAVVAFRPLRRAEEVAEASAARVLPPPPASAGTSVTLSQEEAGPKLDQARHNEIMAANAALVRQLGPPTSPMRGAPLSRSLLANDTLTLFGDAKFVGGCSSRGRVRAVVRFSGKNALWLEDIDNPADGFTEPELAELDALYATQIKPVHDDYYGGLSDVDGNRRVLVLMTKEVNLSDGDDTLVGGWTWFGDLYPVDDCGTSNHAEILFGRVPDPEGVFGHPWTREEALDFYPPLLTHEMTHLVQARAEVFDGAGYSNWEIEGGATLSEHLVADRVFGHGSGQNLGSAAFRRGLDWYRDWARGMAHFFGLDSDDPDGLRRVPDAPEQCSWMGFVYEGNDGPCKGSGRAVYDVPSMVLRYAMDRWGGEYAGGEQALLRRLNQSAASGLTALEEVSAWRSERILADFYITLWLDLNGWEAHGMTTWDLADVWSQFSEGAQLRPWVSTTASVHGDWSVRAGSTFYLHWSPPGARGPTSLRVTSPGGASLPGHMSVWALRIR
ncbi:IPT/TIG domain-containing protein [Candidatus Palauibacter polyketidifaciens]|uniref:IPT/TIG domain-containing protein n=1 Tax=Candidatus Palauibacter polyketidifaciens TaxID=3056740 RepID=UPI00238832C9|nr:IPT/TIG domain-containing protein [Candidatus Palauibacter polyketidifaciens]MDE2721630.1 IPT/TIG domain-containing protein [Candidatus Palauibacter polyketidifaciens]